MEAIPESDRLLRDDRSEMDSVRVAISSEADLQLWWERATSGLPDPRPAPPAIDFARHTVLLVSSGRSNAGDRIRVDSIGFGLRLERGGGQSEGWFAVVRTLPDCNPFPGVAYPVEVVRVPRVTGEVEFRERVANCPVP